MVLAGGRGRRLAAYTSVLPKPLMPVGERAILEIVVEQLEAHGITRKHLLRRLPLAPDPGCFDNPANGHVNISYVQEQGVLGTAGPLRLVDGLDQASSS